MPSRRVSRFGPGTFSTESQVAEAELGMHDAVNAAREQIDGENAVTVHDELRQLRASLKGRNRWIRILSVLVALLAFFLAIDVIILAIVLS